MNLQHNFRHFANKVTDLIGSPHYFLIAFLLIFIWIIVGFWQGFSEFWQLIIDTTLTVVTFLMVLVIQHTQYRETRSMQLKLDEIIKGVEGSRNGIVGLQEQPDDKLDALQQEFKQLSDKA